HYIEWKHSDGGSIWQRQGRACSLCCGTETHTVDPHWPSNVLKLLLTCVLEGDLKLTFRVLLHPTGDTDAPGLRQPLQTRGYVHSVPEDVIAVDDDVTLVNADPELDALVLGHLCVAFGHPALDLDSTAEGVHHARELHEHPVPGGLHDPSPVLGDLRVYQSPAVGLEPGERPFFGCAP